jgi:acetyl esterase
MSATCKSPQLNSLLRKRRGSVDLETRLQSRLKKKMNSDRILTTPPSWSYKQRSRKDLNTPLSTRNHNWRDNPNIDNRIRSFFSTQPFGIQSDDKKWVTLLNQDAVGGGEKLIPSTNFSCTAWRITSLHGKTTFPVSIIRPKPKQSDPKQSLPCVIYIHGGGMSHYSSFYKNFQTLGRLIASHGVVVVMPDFRNSSTPSMKGENVGPFPCGLNDCEATVQYCYKRALYLGIDRTRIVVAGESGGGNLGTSTVLRLLRKQQTLQKEHVCATVAGLYILCPYLKGKFGGESLLPVYKQTSTTTNAGIFLDYDENTTTPMLGGYGYQTTALNQKLHDERIDEAWPGYLTEATLSEYRRVWPKTRVVVNEFDPLRDDGIDFANKLAAVNVLNGVECEVLKGTTHGIGSYLHLCPEISVRQGRLLAEFAITAGGRSSSSSSSSTCTL